MSNERFAGFRLVAHDFRAGVALAVPGGERIGALQYINSVGVAKFAARADALAARYGERYACPKIVRDKAKAGEAFV